MIFLHSSAYKVQPGLPYEGIAEYCRNPHAALFMCTCLCTSVRGYSFINMHTCLYTHTCIHMHLQKCTFQYIYNTHVCMNTYVYKIQHWLCLWWQNCPAHPASLLVEEVWSFFTFPGKGTWAAAASADSQLQRARDCRRFGSRRLASLSAAAIVVWIIWRLYQNP